MRRRDLLAGLGSVGVLGAAGLVAVGGVPSGGRSDDSAGGDGGGDEPEPVTIETIEAPGSRDGTVTIPATGEPTFVDFFATWCNPCETQMPDLAAANERVGDEVLFVSVTIEPVGDDISEDHVVEWWDDHGGDWLMGADPTTELWAQYSSPGIPHAVALDAEGRVRWSESGAKTADELVAGIERALPDGR